MWISFFCLKNDLIALGEVTYKKMEGYSQGPHLCPRSSCAGHLLPASHDADHLLPGGLSHESPIHNPRHVVGAPSQTHQRPVACCHHVLWLALTAAAELSRESQPPEGCPVCPLPRQGHSFMGLAAAYVPDELLDKPSVPLGSRLHHSTDGDAGGFSSCRRLPRWTGSMTGPWGSEQTVSG